MGCKKNSPCTCCGKSKCICGTKHEMDHSVPGVPETKKTKTLIYPTAVEDMHPLPPMSPGVEVKF